MTSTADKLTRIAIVDSDRCKPKKCRQECKRSCPVVRMGKLCIEVAPTSKIAWISEELCIGCGICVKKCPQLPRTSHLIPSSLARAAVADCPPPRIAVLCCAAAAAAAAARAAGPFEAIQIINLPKNLEKDTTHRYGPNSFKLHRLPMPRPGQVLGLVGTNGIGQSTRAQLTAQRCVA